MFRITTMLAAGFLAVGMAAMGTLRTVRADANVKPMPPGAADQTNSSVVLTAERFQEVADLIKPAAGESRWQEIPWLLDVYEARKKAAEEGKPILIWSGGGAPPLGGC